MSARKLEPIVAEPGQIAARQPTPTLAVGQVGRRQGECPPVGLLLADQYAPDLVRHVHPLVQIKGQRVGALHAGNQVPRIRGQGGPGAKGTVHVQPQVLLGAELCQRVQVVDRAGVGRPGCANDAEWQVACPAILRDGRAQRRQVDLKGVVDRHQVEGIAAQAQQLDRLLDRAVDLLRGIEDHGLGGGAEAFVAQVEPGLGVARHGEPDQVGGRAAAGQQAAG